MNKQEELVELKTREEKLDEALRTMDFYELVLLTYERSGKKDNE